MAKVGTAHIEIKPMLNDDSLSEIADRIADAVYVGFVRGMERAKRHGGPIHYGDAAGRTRDEVDAILADRGHDLSQS